ncbi:ZIP family metal transporter [Parvularcula dongshanensis]|uniref:ZIP family zinc transporter n=1 Tax=Parvularcula dongshanensis TaxID=1173995 RepID=A0A840I394_9PROT|nr:ZIP family metal transporter [Parvularcula dongshanensis]MBB4658743.1 ZIP family zinc transporter [Parvularcula dongshanensis]
MAAGSVTVPPAVWASLIAAALATLGLVAAALRSDWAVRQSPYFTTFAAGVLVTTALMLLPAAATLSTSAPFAALAGYLLLYGVNLSFKETVGAALAPLLAIGLHSFFDGIEYGVLFAHDEHMGAVASVGLVAHEFAEGVVLFAVLRAAGLRLSRALLGAFLGAAATTPVGAIASQGLLAVLPVSGLGLLLAGAAGALLYVGATHLPGHLGHKTKPALVATYLFGVAVALAFSFGHADHRFESIAASTEVAAGSR